MNIWTWNVNSIRSKIHLVNQLLITHGIDILVVTETKIKSTHEADLTPQINPNYSVIWSSNKISYYHGVAVIYKKSLNITMVSDYLPRTISCVDPLLCKKKNSSRVLEGLRDTSRLTEDIRKAHTLEGRIITIYCDRDQGNSFALIGSYVPNSGVNRRDPLKRLGYRTVVWDKDMYSYLLQLNKQCSNIIWLGDLNVARLNYDMNNPKRNYAGTTPEERYNLNNFLKTHQWVDTWDHSNPTLVSYNDRWTYGVDRQMKLRLDYVICSPNMKDKIISSTVDHNCLGSDHVPMGTRFSI